MRVIALIDDPAVARTGAFVVFFLAAIPTTDLRIVDDVAQKAAVRRVLVVQTARLST